MNVCWEEVFDGDCIEKGEKSKGKSKQKGEEKKEQNGLIARAWLSSDEDCRKDLEGEKSI